MKEFNVNSFFFSSSVDGEGIRDVVFFQGCKHHCKGCHNPDTFNFKDNLLYTMEELLKEIEDNTFCKKVTLSGGDPLEQENIVELAKNLKNLGYNIWLYTGYVKEEIEKSDNKEILNYIDVLVDGKFELDKIDKTDSFRGSINQNIIKF